VLRVDGNDGMGISEGGALTLPVMIKLPSLARVTVGSTFVAIEGPSGRHIGTVTVSVGDIAAVSREAQTIGIRLRSRD